MKVLLLLVWISLVQCSVNNTICVRHSHGSLTAGTWNQDCTEICDSISECDYSSYVFTLIVLEGGDHKLSKSLQFHDRHLIKFHGSKMDTKILCASNSGLQFINVVDVSISKLIIQNCGVRLQSTGNYFLNAIFISRAEMVELLNITVIHSPGNSISLINVHDKVLVDGSIFLSNNMRNVSSGFYIEYSGCDPAVNATKDATQILISNSRFTGKYSSSIPESNIGGHSIEGLSFIFSECASHVSSTISESIFLGNAATIGCGLHVHFLGSSHNNSVTVSSSSFMDNICIRDNDTLHDVYAGGGGGINVVFDDVSSHNAVIIENCKVINNTAFFGGGLLILFQNSSCENTVNIVASNFSNNGHGSNVPTRGGGLSVLLIDKSYGNNVSLNGILFAENRAERGAGMHVQFQNSSEYNTDSVVESDFIFNVCPDRTNSPGVSGGGSGGGIEAGYHFWQKDAPANNAISISFCYFEHNFATFGGGVSLFSSYTLYEVVHNSFSLTGCLWYKIANS